MVDIDGKWKKVKFKMTTGEMDGLDESEIKIVEIRQPDIESLIATYYDDREPNAQQFLDLVLLASEGSLPDEKLADFRYDFDFIDKLNKLPQIDNVMGITKYPQDFLFVNFLMKCNKQVKWPQEDRRLGKHDYLRTHCLLFNPIISRLLIKREDFPLEGSGVSQRAQAVTPTATMAAERKRQRELETRAATKIQAVQRGKKGRRDVELKREAEAKEKKETTAATKIQAVHRGKTGRKAVASQRATETRAATKIQAMHRGKRGREDVASQRATVEEEEQAASSHKTRRVPIEVAVAKAKEDAEKKKNKEPSPETTSSWLLDATRRPTAFLQAGLDLGNNPSTAAMAARIAAKGKVRGMGSEVE